MLFITAQWNSFLKSKKDFLQKNRKFPITWAEDHSPLQFLWSPLQSWAEFLSNSPTGFVVHYSRNERKAVLVIQACSTDMYLNVCLPESVLKSYMDSIIIQSTCTHTPVSCAYMNITHAGLEQNLLFPVSNSLSGWRDGSVDKGDGCQGWWPAFEPQGPHGRREPTPTCCLLTSTQALLHVCQHTHPNVL